MNIKLLFISKLGKPNNIKKLQEYINFVKNNNYKGKLYSEKHHILPKSKFKKYINEDWNIVTLKYEDHVKTHELLFESYNIRSFQMPINCMSDYKKTKKQISNAAKTGWENLKNNKKQYNIWKKKRKKYMKKVMSSDGYLYKIHKNRIPSKEEKKNKSKTMKDFYKNLSDERKEEIRQNKIKAFNKPENIKKQREISKKRWSDPKFKKENVGKIIKISKDTKNRKINSEKGKLRWSNLEYRKKMKKRKPKPVAKTTLEIYELIKKGISRKETYKMGYNYHQYRYAKIYFDKMENNNETKKS